MEAASLVEKLLQEGWNLTPSALEIATDNGKISDVKGVIRKLLDIDLRTVSQGSLPEDINRTKYESLPGGTVLQVQKVKNLSFPKYQENQNPNASIIKLVLTDGVQNVQGVPMENIPALHVNMLPGSKILLTGEVEITHCFLLLTLENTAFIGGKVEQMIAKWELNRKLAKHKRVNQEEGGPPPWIPFGQKILANQILTDKNFKSLDQGKNRDITENSEFEAQRKGAILEASKIGAPKVFGGGNNKLLDHNVQVIVDAGFTIEQAEYALKLSKNNPDRALRSLQSKTTKPGKEEGGKGGKPDEKGGKGGKGRGRHRDEEGGSSLKPSGKVSLFDFLEDKLPVTEKEVTIPSMETRNNFHDKKPNKSSKPPNDRQKPYEEKKNYSGERSEGRNSIRTKIDGPKIIPKYDANEKKMRQQQDVIKFDSSKRNYDPSKNDKSFGNFKIKNDFPDRKQHDSGRSNRVPSEKRETRPPPTQGKNYYNRSEKTYETPEDSVKKQSNFVPTNEKPPRFQKFQQNQNQNSSDNQPPHWSDPYNRLPHQNDFQLQNSLANLTLQRNIANYANHNSHDQLGVANNAVKNVFYGNLGIADTHRPPPTTQSVPPSGSYPPRNPAGYIQPDMKNSAYPGLPNVPDFPFKNTGAMMPGFSDFQTIFGNTSRAANNAYPNNNFSNSVNSYSTPPNSYNNTQNSYNTTPAVTYNNTPPAYNNTPTSYNTAQTTPNNFNNYTTAPPFLSAAPPMLQAPAPAPPPVVQAPPLPAPPQQHQPRFVWKKGQKCVARYWEDQMYYSAVVTGVSENTCVVRFTDYGNYEEVLQNDCVPLQETPPES